MKKTMLGLAAAAMMIAPIASAGVRFGVVVGGPFFYAPAPFWGAYWGPGPYYAYPNAGEVKLDTKVKDAQVFINGAFAGTTKENKTMHLRPGSYNIEIREGGQTQFAQQVYVAAGKTIHLQPEL
ncbi:MAG TPA: PEGA domain-containing protein [Bryobacteraceae bacterium]|nr:PEGA domain-containing protein [Bryobacteraceae bacterium]